MAIRLGFLPKPLLLPCASVLPARLCKKSSLDAHKFRQIRDSIREIGLIEPLSVTAVDRKSGKHLLLDGHVRMLAMQELDYLEYPCLVATDDEAFTYNNRVNRLSSVQEHVMIRRAIDRGVAPERLALVLCIDLARLKAKAVLLDGICEEAVRLLKSRHFSPEVTGVLRKLAPARQVECVQLMLSANNLGTTYARALFSATPPSMRVGDNRRATRGISGEQIATMEQEMQRLQARYKDAESRYGNDMLNLVLAKGYLARLVANPRVSQYLDRLHPELLAEFTSVAATLAMA